MKLSIGNLNQSIKEEDLKKLLGELGKEAIIHIKKDKKTNTSLGYGVIDVSTEALGHDIIKKFNGKEIEGKKIVIVESEKLQEQFGGKDAHKNAGQGGGKLNSKSSGFGGGGGMIRRSGGGGRGK